MSEQQRKELLRKVELGEISVDEALRQLEEADKEERAKSRGDDLAQLRAAVSDVLQEVSESLKDTGELVNDVFTDVGKDLRDNKDLRGALAGLFGGLLSIGPGHTFEYIHEGEFSAENIKVELRGKNGKLDVRSWDGAGYKLKVRVNMRAASEAEAKELSQQAYKVTASDSSLKLEVISQLRNGGISAELLLPSSTEYNLNLDTSNGSVHVADITGDALAIDTSNGAVTLSGCCYERARVDTSNGSVTLNGHCGEVEVHTSNGSIRVDSAGAADSRLDLATSNGSITLVLNEAADTGYSIEASTSNGKVTADVSGLSIVAKGRNTLSAKSDNYDSCSHHTQISARTSNGRISISHR